MNEELVVLSSILRNFIFRPMDQWLNNSILFFSQNREYFWKCNPGLTSSNDGLLLWDQKYFWCLGMQLSHAVSNHVVHNEFTHGLSWHQWNTWGGTYPWIWEDGDFWPPLPRYFVAQCSLASNSITASPLCNQCSSTAMDRVQNRSTAPLWPRWTLDVRPRP